MTVAFDSTAAPARLGGAGHYMVELVAALDRAGVDLTVLARGAHLPTYRSRAPGARLVTVRADRRPLRLAWEQSVLPARLRRLRVDVLHSPHYTTPLLSPVPIVATFFDATFFTHPELHEPVKVAFFRTAMRLTARWAARVVTTSEATRAAVLEHIPADPDRLHVVPAGVDHEQFRPPCRAEVEAFRTRHRITRPWVAFLGTLEPRKNLPRLISAFSRLASDWDGDLLLAGQPGWKAAAFHEALAKAPPDRVRRLGYVSDDERRPFLGGAAAVCYPSLAEGFGLPVLEAMACAAPLVTADISATAEVAGDAAVLVDPTDDADIERGLRLVLSDAGLADRLRAAGPARAAPFTWEAAAHGMRAIYQAAVG